MTFGDENSPLEFQDLFQRVEGLPHPDWKQVRNRITERAGGAAAVWTDAMRQWLTELTTALGPEYAQSESGNFLVVSPIAMWKPLSVARFAEACRNTLFKGLPGVVQFESPGKTVVVVLREGLDYYRYIHVYYPEGRHGSSGGVHLRSVGYSHIAIQASKSLSIQSALSHELLHASIGHLSMPRWIEEGLAQLFQGHACGDYPRTLTVEQARMHRRVWKWVGLAPFWRGVAFDRPGKIRSLSYQLAVLMVSTLIEEHGPGLFGLRRRKQQSLLAYLREAEKEDGGEGALRKHLGLTLADLGKRFLGPGDWGIQRKLNTSTTSP